MDIYLHNTLTGRKEKFEPIEAGKVSMYNCGPTVYNYAHIGNLRSYVFADILRRVFEYNNLEVKQVINVTDIGHLSSDADDGEDKMTKALKREEKPFTLEAMREVAEFYFHEFEKDLKDLNIESPNKFPFASDHIKEDIELVEKLNKANFTYAISDGIYFDVSKFPDYGKLGNIKFGGDTESRIGENSEKKNQRDFAVWKFNKELGYDAPFGKGFPGWHIECTAMSVKYLGPEFDIHTGGIDHIPVHHNNEVAQAVCSGSPYAHYWLHNAHLNIASENGSEKMAKSGENFLTLRTLKDRKIDPIALRYVYLGARYSSPLQFSWETLEGADNTIRRLRNILSAVNIIKHDKIEDNLTIIGQYKEDFNKFINDDLDTPRALALFWKVFGDNINISFETRKQILLNFDKVLGLNLSKKEQFDIPEQVQKLITERDEARKNKDFSKSDEIRAEIEKHGFEVKDTPEGTVVNPK
jgi:cysteinyl-tRNA synthetase